MSFMTFNVLVINPGSTSTKLALYEDEREIFKITQRYDVDVLQKYKRVVDQKEFRLKEILKALEENNCDIGDLSAVVGRGGLLHPLEGGTYIVNEDILKDLSECRYGDHASNLGAILAYDIAKMSSKDIPAFIVDPVVVDEMEPEAKISGIPEIERKSILHALNQKAVARKAVSSIGKRYEEANVIVAHMGGGISVGAHRNGKIIDVNNAYDGDGPFAPERAGGLPAGDLVKLCFSGKYTLEQMKKKLVGGGGLVAHLGTNDLREVKRRIKNGDKKAELVYNAMAYQVAKEIGLRAVVLYGKVDVIALTGGLAYDDDFVSLIKSKVEFIAPVEVYPGEFEMEALRDGALRVLKGEEEAKIYKRI